MEKVNNSKPHFKHAAFTKLAVNRNFCVMIFRAVLDYTKPQSSSAKSATVLLSTLPLFIISANPLMLVSGVFSSCDTFAVNCSRKISR